jgi:hypothetical protein
MISKKIDLCQVKLQEKYPILNFKRKGQIKSSLMNVFHCCRLGLINVKQW